MVRRSRFLRARVRRTVGQVAVSVVATFIATTLYSGLRHAFQGPSAAPVVQASGSVSKPIQRAAVPPVSSVVNWTLRPSRVGALIEDEAWQPFQDHPAAQPLPRSRVRDFRRPSTIAMPNEAPAAGRAVPAAQPDLQSVQPALMSEVRDTGFWSATRSVTRSALQTVESLGGSVVSRVLH